MIDYIMPFPDVFKIFDSHSQDLHGMPYAFGYAVLTSVEGVENLVEYFHLISNSCHLNLGIPFEIKGFNCSKRNELSNRNSTESLQFACFEHGSTISKQHNTNMMASIQEKNRVQRKNESSEQREKRLAKARDYKKINEDLKKKSSEKLKIKRQNESIEKKKTRLAKQRDYQRALRQNESPEQREKRLAKARSYRKLVKETKGLNANMPASKNNRYHNSGENIEQLIRNFHNSVCTGPLYICTCCDQLWYKHLPRTQAL